MKFFFNGSSCLSLFLSLNQNHHVHHLTSCGTFSSLHAPLSPALALRATRKEPRKRTRRLHQPTASQPLRFSRIFRASPLSSSMVFDRAVKQRPFAEAKQAIPVLLRRSILSSISERLYTKDIGAGSMVWPDCSEQKWPSAAFKDLGTTQV